MVALEWRSFYQPHEKISQNKPAGKMCDAFHQKGRFLQNAEYLVGLEKTSQYIKINCKKHQNF